MERIIELIKYLFLSFVQGVGEILPISSSGHLMLLRDLFGIKENGIAIELILHVASLLALFFFYRKTIFSLFKGLIRYLFYKDKNYYKDYKFVIGMIISLVPTCVVGYLFDDYLDYFLNYSFMIGIFLVINGINLYLIKNKKTFKNIEELNFFSFFRIGLGQCLGLIPGFSRSGSALSMCYRENLNKDDSEKFTFLMLFPLVVGSVILNINDFDFEKGELLLLIISFLFTFIITLISVSLLKLIIQKDKLYYFSFYCLIVGVLVIIVG